MVFGKRKALSYRTRKRKRKIKYSVYERKTDEKESLTSVSSIRTQSDSKDNTLISDNNSIVVHRDKQTMKESHTQTTKEDRKADKNEITNNMHSNDLIDESTAKVIENEMSEKEYKLLQQKQTSAIEYFFSVNTKMCMKMRNRVGLTLRNVHLF